MKILVNDFAGHPFQIQLSRALASAGHTVSHTYFAANNTPKGATEASGVNLTITGVAIGRQFEKHSLVSRRAADISYGKGVGDRIRKFHPDVVISANTPLDAQRLLLAATREVGGKFAFWLQDLLSVGMEFVLRKKKVPFAAMAGSFYRRIERRLLRESDAIVCISPSFCGTLDEWEISPEKVFVIPNWAPLEEVLPMARSTAWSGENGIADKFCFMYSGTLGMKHKPELLLELARHFQSREDVVTVVIADGAGADWLKQNRGHVREGCLKILPFQPYERLREVLASSDVLITLLDHDCGAFAVPSKTLAYLCAARPLLVAAPENNLAAEIVRGAGAGEAVAPTVPDVIAAATRLLEDERMRQACAKNARSYAERTFEIDRIVCRFVEVFEFALQAPREVVAAG
jgi:colanic acid biosynthesis glycosyl transferase WcaI